MIAYLYPKKSVGIFEFKKSISNYIDKMNLLADDDTDDITGWQCFRLNSPDLCIYTNELSIVSISCYEECILKGNNIIGMNINHFKLIYKIEEDGEIDKIFIDDYIQLVYEFEVFGLQIWTKNEVIITAIASADE